MLRALLRQNYGLNKPNPKYVTTQFNVSLLCYPISGCSSAMHCTSARESYLIFALTSPTNVIHFNVFLVLDFGFAINVTIHTILQFTFLNAIADFRKCNYCGVIWWSAMAHTFNICICPTELLNHFNEMKFRWRIINLSLVGVTEFTVYLHSNRHFGKQQRRGDKWYIYFSYILFQ